MQNTPQPLPLPGLARGPVGPGCPAGPPPAPAAAVVAQRADEHARKADDTAQRFGRGHAVGVAVDEMGKDHA